MKCQVAILICYSAHIYIYVISMKENLRRPRLYLFIYSCVHAFTPSITSFTLNMFYYILSLSEVPNQFQGLVQVSPL